ncbi:4-(cytidine 5'-diphospho)-2-C-methyl-D-erythritol kinase [Solemya velesiana gill symbiont]|uniref:4-diphosphocytidyl-2-C-methyl-D-erythritol kinase n=2 Tax=Solemya velesiana gill symbiont TaxID=1918948 RepID=A0A1T2KYH6_9GAMM|nr:4-(cytidine 5'-diphospho)-2-C-methyl-D-erythritol kinase [Solemya velesiana gill symbiont]
MGPIGDTWWPAPAKLNLLLRVVGRRQDGYHLLQTVFQFLDFGDRLRFRLRDDGQVRRLVELAGVPEARDLVVRAARLLQEEAGITLGADIELDKRLPMGGGLGGGSSDAATTLVVLNKIWRAGLSTEHLAELGLTLGADVPVFVRGVSAWGEGVGEHLTPVELPEPWFLVLVPGCEVPTADIFGDPDLTRDSPRITIRDFLAGRVENDCIPVVCRRFPEVAEAMDWLAQPRLTGTGACVFAVFASEADALRVKEAAAGRYQAFVARGVNHSPLLKMVEQ